MFESKWLIAVGFHSIIIFSILWKSMATVNCLVDILQSIFFCVQQMIETQTGLKQVEGKYGCTVPLTVLNADLSVLKNTRTHTHTHTHKYLQFR